VNRLWVSFRGTASLKGLIKDFKAHAVPMDSHFAAVSPHKTLLSILHNIPLMLQGCKVHVGFYETYVAPFPHCIFVTSCAATKASATTCWAASCSTSRCTPCPSLSVFL
jgi:hypothetical protein